MAHSMGPPPAGGDATRIPTMIGVYAGLATLSILCTAGRIYTRFRLLRMPGLDDAVVLVSIAMLVANFGLLIKATTFGLGRHEYYLTPENFVLSVKWNYIGAPIGIMGVAVPKLAVVIFLAKVVGPAKRYQLWALYFLVVTLIILSAVASILLFAECSPPSAAWKPNIPHTCWNPAILENFSFFVGAYSAFNDIVLASFPATVIFKLQMSWKRKMSISFLMGLGVVACVCAIVRTTKLAALRSLADWSWRESESVIWTNAEMNVIIICACIPTLAPLVQQVTGQKDYLSKPKAALVEPNKYNPISSKTSVWNSIAMRPMKSQGTVDATAAFHDEEREGSLPEGEIRTTTKLQTQWEAV